MAKLDDEDDPNTQMVIALMKPLFANVFVTPIPPLDMFEEYLIDYTLPVTVKESLTNSFAVRKDAYWEIPMFQEKAFETWYTNVLPQF